MSDCSSCTAALPPAARFCPSCGAAQLVLAGERRFVTVLFADLAGFTTMAEGRDPEAVKELLDSCFGALVPVVDAHGGVVDKIIGDELMAVFGAPVAHEDDAERAVRAGVALLDALTRLDPSLEMRVGINTGEVLAGPVGPGGAYTVTGDTVNTAHRLVGVAARGSVLVAERTHAATQGAIAYGPPAQHRLRGRLEPVVAYPAEAVRYAPGAHPGPAVSEPMIGRTAELDRLVQAVEGAVVTSTPRVVTVLGEAGLGKSRLVDELAPALERHGRPVRVITVHCAPYGAHGPLAPLAALVARLLEVDEHRSLEQRQAVVAGAVAALAPLVEADRGHLLDRVQQLLGLAALPASPTVDVAPGRSRLSDELVTAARLVIEACATRAPLVVVLDDAQFAEPAVLELVERTATWAGPRPLVLVTVGREELADRSPSLATSVQGHPIVIRLEPLDDEASGRLLERTLVQVDGHTGHLRPTDEVQLLRAAGGNPLLLDQLARYLRESEALVPVEGGWRATRRLEDAGLPDGARALLGARLDALPAAERAVLQGASIVGRTFEPDAVAAVGVRVEDEVLVHLWRRGLLLVGDADGELSFRHAMVREAAYASVALGERAEQHARLGRWLAERAHPGDEGQVAHHFERAVALGRDLGHVDPALAAEAGRHVVQAAEAARARDALREAATWCTAALELDLLDGAEAVRVALLHGTTLLALRACPEAASVLRGVLALTEDPRAIGEASTGLGVAARLLGDTDEGERWFAAGRAAWVEAGDPVGEASSLRTHGWAELVVGRPRAALPKLLRSRELEEAAGSPLGTTLQCLAWCEFLLGDHAAARAHLWDAARELSAANDRLGLGWCFGILGNSLWQEGRVEQARTVAESLLAAAGGQGDPWGEGMCQVLLAGCLLEAGEVAGARAAAAAAEHAFAELADPWGAATACLLEGMVERVGGDLPGARAALERGLEATRGVGAVGTEARLRAELAATLLDQGDEQGADRQARATLALVRNGDGDRDSEIRALVILAKRSVLLQDDPDAGRLLAEAVELAAGEVPTSIWRRAVAVSALLVARHGEAARAGRLAADALDGSWESARTWVLATRAVAAAQRADGDLPGALRTLRQALERFEGRPLAFVQPVRDDVRSVQSELDVRSA